MCGIFGAIHLNGFYTKEDFHFFSSLTDMVAYRGPDASGYRAVNVKQDPGHEDRFDVFIGHRRLSIIDLSNAANQPLTDGAGRWIVFNGEIFNYIELRDELIQEGQCFKTASDTEVILGIYKQYGEDGFSKLNGMWAFAIVDGPRKKVILSRDRFSIKPLYYIHRDDRFYFSSEIKQILPLLPEKKINDNSMFVYLAQGLTDHNEESFFQGVCQVAAKHNFVIDMEKGGLEKKAYWNYSADAADGSGNLPEAVETFRELFLDSLKMRLRSDVEIGALLSGGLDSSAITVGANEIQNGKLSTFSVISDDKKFSEERFIDLLCRSKQIRNRKLTFRIHSENIQEELETVLHHHDEPFGGFSTLAHFKILELLKKNSGLKVVLSGQGGDEILMGYFKYFFFN
ncbi:MAG: asparagine synthase (glutamine-hydrolyzing), partial [Desulfobacteraceae bacterium]